jgi:hypothetical protein
MMKKHIRIKILKDQLKKLQYCLNQFYELQTMLIQIETNIYCVKGVIEDELYELDENYNEGVIEDGLSKLLGDC